MPSFKCQTAINLQNAKLPESRRGPDLKCLQRRKDTPTPVTSGKYTFSAEPLGHPLSPQTLPTLHYSSLDNLVLICSILALMEFNSVAFRKDSPFHSTVQPALHLCRYSHTEF